MAKLRIFRISVDGIPPSVARPLLTEPERHSAGRFAQTQQARRWIAGRAALRLILAEETGQAPQDIALTVTASGKPGIEGESLCFNLSHSDDLMLCALCDRPVGVDVERVRPMGHYPTLARQFFSLQEQRILLALPEAQQEQAFFRGWCGKEALIKAQGDAGLAPLDRFSIEIHPDCPAALLNGEEVGKWHLYNLDLGPGLVAAAAVAGADEGVSLEAWSRWPLPV